MITRIFSRLAALTVFLALSPSGIKAQSEMDPDLGGVSYTSAAGTSTNLPVGCYVTIEQLESWARTMPAVQAAMDVFQQRGYIAHVASDTATAGCNDNNFTSFVVLTYERPNSYIDNYRAVFPLVLVSSKLNTTSGDVITSVTGGLAYVDQTAEIVFSADSLDTYRTTDPSFDVEYSGGGGGGGPHVVTPEGGWDWLPDRTKFNKYLACQYGSWGGCIAGVAVGIAATGGIGALAAVTPQGALTIVGGCAMISVATCVGQLF